jgi:hypothetical protein
MVAIRDAGHFSLGKSALAADGKSLAVPQGTKVSKSHPAVKADPDAFVAVVPEG